MVSVFYSVCQEIHSGDVNVMLRVYWYVHVSLVYIQKEKRKKKLWPKVIDHWCCVSDPWRRPARISEIIDSDTYGIHQDDNYPQQVYLSNDVQFRFKRTYSSTISLHPRTYESDMHDDASSRGYRVAMARSSQIQEIGGEFGWRTQGKTVVASKFRRDEILVLGAAGCGSGCNIIP